MTSIPLISVIGCVPRRQLEHFMAHYRGQGVERFYFAIHAAPHVSNDELWGTRSLVMELGGQAIQSGAGPWHETLNAESISRLRLEAGAGWHLIADSDEFQTYHDTSIDELIAQADAAETPVVEGMLLDRVERDGRFPDWSRVTNLDAAFPLGGLFTPPRARW